MKPQKTIRRVAALAALCATTLSAKAQNPFLPLWEYIPDGEPYVFEDPDRPGHYRVYVYGSHDSLIDEYCGLEQVTWSAPVEDLTQWRYDGVIFRSEYDRDGLRLNHDGKADLLYAPDIVKHKEADGSTMYYLYPNVQNGGRQGMIAKSRRPDGPFRVCNWSKTNPRETTGILRFDPGVLEDEDGRVYGYWGFEQSFGAELDPATMCTVKPGTEVVTDMVSHYKQDGIFRFFEASSIRKIEDKYVFIYSRWTNEGEFGLKSTNYTLAYAYSDNPLGPFTYGGTIIDGRGRGEDEQGNPIATATPGGNTHGSICEIDGQWWVFYHRQTGLNEYARQAMVAPIEVTVEPGKGGKVTISEAEYTSEGFRTEGLNPFDRTPAGIACYYTSPEPSYNNWPNFYHTGSYVQPTYLEDWLPRTQKRLTTLPQPGDGWSGILPVVNNTAGSVVGYKYFQFDELASLGKANLSIRLVPQGVDGTITIMVGSPYKSKGGKVIGTIQLSKDAPQQPTDLTAKLTKLKGSTGKQALFFVFNSKEKGKSLCEIHNFAFEK